MMTATASRIERVYIEVIDDEDPDVSWLEQTPAELGSITAAVWNHRRLESYKRGDWCLVGIRLAADVVLEHNGRTPRTITLTTPGLWGVESDSGEEYFRAEVVNDSELLGDDLHALGFSWNEIQDAFPDQAAYEVVYRG